MIERAIHSLHLYMLLVEHPLMRLFESSEPTGDSSSRSSRIQRRGGMSGSAEAPANGQATTAGAGGSASQPPGKSDPSMSTDE